MTGSRLVRDFELEYKLRKCEEAGVRVPKPTKSLFSPTYIGTRRDIEIYNYRGTEVRIHPGHVIDNYGNVVDLARLEQKAAYKRGEIPARDLYQ